MKNNQMPGAVHRQCQWVGDLPGAKQQTKLAGL